VLPGAAWLRMLTGIFVAATMLVCSVTLALLRDPRRYTARVATAVGVVCSICAIAIIYYLGIFTAAAAILTVGIYFFGLSESSRAARTTYAACAGLYLLVSASIAADALPDMSMFSTAHVLHASRWYRVVMTQVIFGLTFYLARSSRRSTESAFKRVR